MEIMLVFVIVVLALLSLVVASEWSSVSSQIKTLSDRVNDFYLIAPDSPGIQGTISAKLFEAMKDVCETAKAKAEAEKQHNIARDRGTSLMADVSRYWQDFLKADKEHDSAVERLKKIDETHEIVKR